MRYLKTSVECLCAVCLASAAAFAAPNAKLDECLAQGKNDFSSKNYTAAQHTFERCLQLDAHNVDAELSLAGVFLTQDNFDGAEKYFKEALTHMKRNSPYFSYTYSMLGDIALKRQQYKEASAWYDKSLASNAANVNSLVGKGVITEYNGDKLGAASYYRSAVAVEPLNIIARKKLIDLEPDYFTDEEMLEALKQRFAVAPEKTELTDEDRKLFADIHSAEQRKGVEYLKGKYAKVPQEYVVTVFKDTPFARDLLTLAGYQAMRKQIGQDAIGVFRRGGVSVKDVFNLRDLSGKNIFKEDSTLTDSGFAVYTEALKNRKMFLLPSEPVPPTREDVAKINARLAELKQAGYAEISEAEFKMIQTQTNCSEETLRKQMGLYILPVTAREQRYFIIARPMRDERKGIPLYYVQAQRARRNPRVKVPRNNLVEKQRFYGYTVCKESDGTLWE